MEKIAERIEQIKQNIRAASERVGRDWRSVKLVIVTKSTTIENIEKVIRLGYRDLGENRVQQLKKVAGQVSEILESERDNPDVPESVNWHMIGHLQRNKVQQALSLACLIHSVDTLRLSEEISICAGKLGICANVLLQVNTSQEPQKYGVPVGAAVHLAEQIQTLPNIRLAGMMTMGPLTRDNDVIRGCFVRARELFEEIKGEKIAGAGFKELSMGMSSDYEIAVEEGSTIVRVGSAIFSGL